MMARTAVHTGNKAGTLGFRMAVEPDLDAIRGVRKLLERLGAEVGLERQTVNQLVLAAEEVLVNIMNHGLHGSPRADIRLCVELTGDDVVMEFSDNGRPFNPLSAPMPDLESPVEHRPVGGLGVFLVKQITERQSYARECDRNVFRVWKRR